MYNDEKDSKGITLMVLVITIIVMLILAAVVVKLALGDGGVLEEARGAANEWDKATEAEQSDLSKLAQEMRNARNGIYNRTTGSGGSSGDNSTGGGDTSGNEIGGGDADPSNTIAEITGNESSNTETKDKLGNKIVVPAGFKVVNPEDDITKGIVIEDVSAGDANSKGNQYVWIPISHYNGVRVNTITDSSGNDHIIELARYIFNSDGTVRQKTEDATEAVYTVINKTYSFREDYSQEYSHQMPAKDINAFIESAKNNGGYYIARYEAGDTITELERSSSSSQETVPVFKANQTAYNYITQVNAATLVRNLYSNQSEKYISDLVNSFAWDTAIVFIQEFSGDTNYSNQVGLQNTLTKTGESTDGTNKDIRCNIYDMAGNVTEWNTERYITMSPSQPDVARGGTYNGGAVLSRYSNSGSANQTIAFRRNYISITFKAILFQNNLQYIYTSVKIKNIKKIYMNKIKTEEEKNDKYFICNNLWNY